MATPTLRETLSDQVLYTDPEDFVTVTTTGSGGSATQVGDWLIAVHSIDYGAASQMTAPTPGLDWAEIAFASDDLSLHMRVWARRVHTAGAQTITVTHTDVFADSALVVMVVAGAGSNLVGSYPAFNYASALSPHVAPQIDPTDANELMISGWIAGRNDGSDGSYGNYTAPSGMTKRAEVDCAPYSTTMVTTLALTSASLTGTKSAAFTPNTASQVSDYVSFSLSLREYRPPPTIESEIIIHSEWTARKETSRTVESPVEVSSELAARKEVHVQTESEVVLGDSYSGVKNVQVLPAGGPIYLTLWLVTDTGSYIALPDFTSLQLSPVVNGPGSVSVSYPESGLNFAHLHAMIEDDRDLEVAIWVGGREEGSMRAVLTGAHGDEVDEQAIWSFTGAFLEQRMEEAFVWPADPIVVHETTTAEDGTVTTTEEILNPNREAIFEQATAGKVMRALMIAAHGRGVLTDINSTSFTDQVGSNGRPFTVVATLKLSPGTTLLALLGSMVDLGMCEWEVVADAGVKRLNVYEPDTRGKDRSAIYPPIVLRAGKDVTDSPRTYSTDGTATHMLGSGKDGIYAEADDSVAEERRGKRIEKYVSQGSINDSGTLLAYLQAQLASDATGKMELSHGLAFPEGGPVPLADFDRYDWVWSDQGWGLERLRVSQWTINQDEHGMLSGSAVLNDLTSDWEESLAKRLARLEGGSIIIGTPTPDSPPPANGYKRPAAPTGVVASSLSYQDLSLGTATTYAAVTAGWSEVFLNEDSSELTVAPYYRVRYRYSTGTDHPTAMWPHAWEKDTGDGAEWIAGAEGTGTTLSFSGLSPARLIEVQVATVIPLDPPGPYEVDEHNRAFRRTTLQSHWSEGFELTTDTDTVAPAAPSTPVMTEYLGTMRISWDGLDLDGLSMAPDFRQVEVHLSTVNNFTPDSTTYRDTLFGSSATVITDLLYEVGYFSRLVAIDIAGNRSEPSATAAAHTRKLLGDDIFANAIGSAHLAYAAVKEANIDYLAVNNSHIQNLNVGKLTSGQINADMLLAGRIKTATTGARIEFDNVSFRQYNTANELRTQFLASNGDALVTGTIRSATMGERFELNPSGTLRVYPETGSNYSAMFNAGDEVVFRGQFDEFGRAGYLRLNSNGVAIQYGYLGIDGQDPDAEILAQVSVQTKNIDLTAPVNGLRADGRYSAADSLGNRNVFLHNDDDGDDIAGSAINHYSYSNECSLEIPGRNLNIYFYNPSGSSTSDPFTHDRFVFEYNDGANADIECGYLLNSGVLNPSSITGKTGIRDIPFESLDVVRNSPVKAWKRTRDVDRMRRPDKPKLKVRKRKEGTDVNSKNPDDFEYVDAEWPAGSENGIVPAIEHIGPMAEDLKKVAPNLVLGDGEKQVVNFTAMVGVLWQAVQEQANKIDELTDKFNDIAALPGRKPKDPNPPREK